MKLQQLIEKTTPLLVNGSTETDIKGIEIDSRQIKDGYAFVAMRGTQADGHNYIEKAVELGAKAVICEKLPETLSEGVTYVQYESTEDVVGPLATHFFGDPTEKMKLVGVTGTNGKTTIAASSDTSADCAARCATISTASPSLPNVQRPTPSLLTDCWGRWRMRDATMHSWR